MIKYRKRCSNGDDPECPSYAALGYYEGADPYDSYPQFCSDLCQVKWSKEHRTEAVAMRIQQIIPERFRKVETDKQGMLNNVYGHSVFITGEVGTGKTVFLCSLLKRYIRELQPCRFLSFPKWIMDLQSSFRDDECRSHRDIANEIASFRGVLAIDDLGAEKLTDFVRQIIYFIINEREQNEYQILITSNLSLEEIDRLVDPRISSRIAGMCKVLEFGGNDRRLIRVDGEEKEFVKA